MKKQAHSRPPIVLWREQHQFVSVYFTGVPILCDEVRRWLKVKDVVGPTPIHHTSILSSLPLIPPRTLIPLPVTLGLG